MILYYETFPAIPDVSDEVTLFVVSGDHFSARVNFKDPAEKRRKQIIDSLLGAIPLSNKVYNATTHVWTIIGYHGALAKKGIEALINGKALTGVEIKEQEDLENNLAKNHLGFEKPKPGKPSQTPDRLREEDFFYSQPSTEPTGATLLFRLAQLLEITADNLKILADRDLKRLYRQRAMALHPDRNNGDGSKMAELNQLYALYLSK